MPAQTWGYWSAQAGTASHLDNLSGGARHECHNKCNSCTTCSADTSGLDPLTGYNSLHNVQRGHVGARRLIFKFLFFAKFKYRYRLLVLAIIDTVYLASVSIRFKIKTIQEYETLRLWPIK